MKCNRSYCGFKNKIVIKPKGSYNCEKKNPVKSCKLNLFNTNLLLNGHWTYFIVVLMCFVCLFSTQGSLVRGKSEIRCSDTVYIKHPILFFSFKFELVCMELSEFTRGDPKSSFVPQVNRSY